ncbi:hypothetical protein QJS10_CPB18g01248 [Acorus calamus]|uniref:Uncharacterized protein n=1 Tax=Acorus calamus TaxID=4465 RepID=A0AAV9CK81_ACOCL|nr:hypothetical protein QJS10_CPB18g01248 [Acorus calamus]
MKPTKMSGFLCHSPAATTVCVPCDPRSMIMPRRRASSHQMRAGDQARLIDVKYAKLDKSPRFGPGLEKARKEYSITSTRERNPSKPCNNIVNPALPPPDHVFQIYGLITGVTSFSIDLESKRVTVMGHVSPVVVLESISKVKKAEFWP